MGAKEVDYEYFNGMNEGIEKDVKSGVDVKKLLGNELIKTLDELTFNFYQKFRFTFEFELRSSYEAIKKSVGFILVPER